MKKTFKFSDIEQIIYALIGFTPYLLALYLVISLKLEVTTNMLFIAALALFAHLLGFSAIRKFGSQLKQVSEQAGRAMSSTTRTSIDTDDKTPDELNSIVHAFNAMLIETERSSHNFQEVTTKMMLYSRDIEKYQKKLREESLSRQRLSRYVGQDLGDKIANAKEHTPLQNKRQMATILFADIRSFTTISEQLEPEMVIKMLNEYFDTMVKIIFRHEGVLDKFVGNSLMATFGVPNAVENGPINAIRAAIEMQQSMESLMAEFRMKGYPVFEIGIGINCGDVVMGNIGSENRMDYTVIGDTVNVAARLEQIAEGQSILVGEAIHRQCGNVINMQPKGGVKVKYRAKSVECYQVVT
ncbi:MAG: adenylate/guanylate cyclase domain-containing protein [Mariprofundus sp.]|nr:adenylate/guanylate cyclase domain-containing protein [Mariprofundus sp.]